MRVEHWICDVRGCTATTTDPVGEKWTGVYVGQDFQCDLCPKHSVDMTAIDRRDPRERWKEIDVRRST